MTYRPSQTTLKPLVDSYASRYVKELSNRVSSDKLFFCVGYSSGVFVGFIALWNFLEASDPYTDQKNIVYIFNTLILTIVAVYLFFISSDKYSSYNKILAHHKTLSFLLESECPALTCEKAFNLLCPDIDKYFTKACRESGYDVADLLNHFARTERLKIRGVLK